MKAALSIFSALLGTLGFLLPQSALGGGNDLKPGQYAIEQTLDNPIQQVCLMNDDSWYGTTFNFSGNGASIPGGDHVIAELWGNYVVHGAVGVEKANTTMTLNNKVSQPGVYWHDWFDDLSYGAFLFAELDFVKDNCDPPFKGKNTHAATEGGR